MPEGGRQHLFVLVCLSLMSSLTAFLSSPPCNEETGSGFPVYLRGLRAGLMSHRLGVSVSVICLSLPTGRANTGTGFLCFFLAIPDSLN